MSAVDYEVTVKVRIVSARADFYEGEQIAVDDWNPNRWTGRVKLRFTTPGGSFVRTVKASVPDYDDGDEFERMEAQMLAHLRRHGVVVDRLDWTRSDSVPSEGGES